MINFSQNHALRGALTLVVLVVVLYAAWRPLSDKWQQSTATNNSGGIQTKGTLCPPQSASSSSRLSPAMWNNETSSLSLVPGELPGYTGWGRPEFTLAGYFSEVVSDKSNDKNVISAGSSWSTLIACRGHALCLTHSAANRPDNSKNRIERIFHQQEAQFFVRAYGPAVVSGRVELLSDENVSNEKLSSGNSDSSSSALYRVEVGPLVDPGTYTLEVVLTFSHPPAVDQFPLKDEQQQKQYTMDYEGYLVSGFPRWLYVVTPTATTSASKNSKTTNVSRDKKPPLCSVSDLTIHNATHGLVQGRWKVMDMVRSPNRQRKSTIDATVALSRYQQSWNSLGIIMDYQLYSCRLLPLPTPQMNPLEHCLDDKNEKQPFQKQKQTQQQQPSTHIIMIGDSVMRLQHQFFKGHFLGDKENQRIRVDFYELYGGYYLTQLVNGPKLRQVLKQTIAPTINNRIILFNTGMHDIHRLCGGEFASERVTYLPEQMQRMSCAQLYQAAIQDLMDTLMPQEPSENAAPTTSLIFQTTSAAWPKYGNWGINWDPRYGQGLPLDSSFVHAFNHIAIETVSSHVREVQQQQKSNNSPPPPLLYMLDSYWMSLARPDHREINKNHEIGKKLSHPGVEVVSAMVRLWSLLILRLLCG